MESGSTHMYYSTDPWCEKNPYVKHAHPAFGGRSIPSGETESGCWVTGGTTASEVVVRDQRVKDNSSLDKQLNTKYCTERVCVNMWINEDPTFFAGEMRRKPR